MRFTFTVEAEVERTEGKFESRDSIGEELREAIEGADPGEVTGPNEGNYAVVAWEVTG